MLRFVFGFLWHFFIGGMSVFFYFVAVTDCSGGMGHLGIDSAVGTAGILFIAGKAAS
ncbi:hypothetical protein [Neisseria zoodegmatis]|uniref:hypothetical protein n=1 Tax=Neisseria zoodegmatis TaxID=326523 RepID=UPI0015F0333E|nr:hypothetical protein [Neisseria zoodegmatis]